jgi:ABC-type multidrug transport system ATPase subunit
VGAIEGVHNYLLAERESGAGVLLISEELEELLALCDRIYVIYEGQIMGEVSDTNIETIGLMMTGTPLAPPTEPQPNLTHGLDLSSGGCRHAAIEPRLKFVAGCPSGLRSLA